MLQTTLHKIRDYRLCAIVFIVCVAGCSVIRPDTSKDTMTQLPTGGKASVYMPQSEIDKLTKGKLFGDTGIPLLGGGTEKGGGGGIGVNVYLWRASLDTTAFLPLMSADPFGGVIITDWYSPPETPNERFKITIYILDRKLRADGLRVSLFRQERSDNIGWRDTTIDEKTVTKLEDAILTRARQLRIAAIRPIP